MTASLCGPNCGFPLFLHVFGAMILVGGVATVVLLAFVSLRRDAGQAALLRRVAFFTMLAVVWPGLIAMRVAAQWVLTKYPGLEDADPGWLGVGFIVGDVGVLVVALTTLFGWLAYRQTRPDRARPATARIFAGLASLYLAALAVAWFAMSAKPGS
jgi:phosphoglycerol transferase MdoB-like AlkP superfamily enzyme